MKASRDAYGPLCAGIDPHGPLLEQWGFPDSVEGLERFAAICTEAFAGRIGFVKPQSAFFERFGARGVRILETLLQDFRHTGTLTILDVKRGDIDSTAAAYAAAYLDEDAPMAADAVTVSPFLGFGSVQPFLDVAEKNDAGVFVLALTSNKEGPEVQHARNGDVTVAGDILSRLKALNGTDQPMGSFGAVVGATIGDSVEDLAINGPLLVPGFGAQGGTPEDLRRLFGSVYDYIIPSTSRALLSEGPDVSALRDSAARVNAELVGS